MLLFHLLHKYKQMIKALCKADVPAARPLIKGCTTSHTVLHYYIKQMPGTSLCNYINYLVCIILHYDDI